MCVFGFVLSANSLSFPPTCPDIKPRSGELRTQKLRSHLVRTQSLTVLPLKPGVGQYIAIQVTLTARDFFLAYFHLSGPFTCISFQNICRFCLCWLPSIRSGQNHIARHSERGEKTRQAVEQVGRQHQARSSPSSQGAVENRGCLLYTSPSPRDFCRSRMPSSA